MRALPALLLLALLLAPPPAHADGRRSHEQARAALAAGEIQPLADLIRQIESRYDGRIVQTELEHENGRWVYEFKLLPPSGRVFMLELDARSGELLRTRGPVQSRP